MSNQSYASGSRPYWLSYNGNDSVSFNKQSTPPLAFFNKGILYEMDDGGLYFNGGLINAGTGGGCVQGPLVSTDTAIAVWDGTTGDLLKNSVLTIGATGQIKAGSDNLISDIDNLLVGNAGSAYTTELDNILISSPGEVGDSKVIRIGNPALHEQAFIAGVDNVFLPYDTSYPVSVSTDNGGLGYSTSINLQQLYIDQYLCAYRTGDPTDWNAFFFAGSEATAGGNVCGFGHGCLANLTDSWEVVAMGSYAMTDALVCTRVVALGAYALYNTTACDKTVAIGSSAMLGRTTGTHNVCVGNFAGWATVAAAAGSSNTVMGSTAGTDYIGNSCVYLGYKQGNSVTGDRNIRIHSDMHGLPSTGSDNIFIGSYGDVLNLAETAAIRLGTQGTQTSCYVAGIYNNLASYGGSRPIRVDATGRISATPISDRGVMGQIAFEDAATFVVPLVVNVPSEMNPGTSVTNVYGTATPGNGRLSYTLSETRTCKFSFCASVKLAAGANQAMLVGLYKNGVAVPQSGLKILLSNSSDFQTVGFNRLISVSAGDYISVYITNLSGSNNVNVYSMCLMCTGYA